MPPEYIDKQEITSKFDVFSLGVIILQIMAGRTLSFQRVDMSSGELTKIVRQMNVCITNRHDFSLTPCLLCFNFLQVHEHWMKRMQTRMPSDASCEVKTCIEIALRCVENDREKRPTITEIVDKLNETDTSKSSSTCKVMYILQRTVLSFRLTFSRLAS
jgi:pyruvate dehydrogenase phosphatase